MAAKHQADGTDSLSEAPTAPEAPTDDPDQAMAMVRAGFGAGGIAWELEFRTIRDGDTTTYVDVSTGEVYDTIPRLHHGDGIPL